MSPTEYIQSRLRACAQWRESLPRMTDTERKVYIEQLIFRKPYRKWKAGDILKSRVPHAVAYTYEHKKPLTFRYWFGGYKLWRLQSAPRIDWAEVFALMYYLEYLAPIAAAHPHGIILQFCSDEYFVEQLNNIPRTDTEAYTASFKELIILISAYLPSSIEIEYTLNRHALGTEELFASEFKKVVDTIRPTWGNRRTPEELERDLASSWLNIRFDSGGSSDLSHFSEREQRDRALESLLLHDALGVFENPLIVDRHQDDSISIFAVSFPDSLGLGTTKSSMVKFWVGTGVLERDGDSFKERILSHKQYDAARAVSRALHGVADVLPHLETIEVFDIPFDFQAKRAPVV